MNVQPVIGANISQMMFYQNEKSVVPSDSVSAAFQNLSALSGINSMPQISNDMAKQMPAFLQQARLSMYYQNNPWNILTSSNKFGVPTMGGDLIPDQPPGSNPGNILKKPANAMRMPSTPSNNMPRSGREHFENDSESIKITWQ
jgi:hypothetical protein